MDSNAVIDYLGNLLPVAGARFMDGLAPAISIVTRMEVLGWHNASATQIATLSSFIKASIVYAIEEDIVLSTILLRQPYRLKLPDAIIAATALVHYLTLLSRNTSDFKNIEGLTVINPHNMV